MIVFVTDVFMLYLLVLSSVVESSSVIVKSYYHVELFHLLSLSIIVTGIADYVLSMLDSLDMV